MGKQVQIFKSNGLVRGTENFFSRKIVNSSVNCEKSVRTILQLCSAVTCVLMYFSKNYIQVVCDSVPDTIQRSALLKKSPHCRV